MRLAHLDQTETGSLEILDGERVVLLGPSGSGKTTLVKQLLGLDRRLINRRGSPLAETCAYVPQSDGVFLDASVLGNVTNPDPHVSGVDERAALDWLDMLGLSTVAARPVADLSQANRRRVSLARALSRRRPLLVIDGDLDPTLQALLPDLLDTVPHLCSVLTTACTADPGVWRADSVALVSDCRVIAQDSMEGLHQSGDQAVRSCLAWVTP